MALGFTFAGKPTGSAGYMNSSELLHEFRVASEGGNSSPLEDYLRRLDPADCRGAVELIYQDYCQAEARGSKPAVADYLARFPQHGEALERLMRLAWRMPLVTPGPMDGDDASPRSPRSRR